MIINSISLYNFGVYRDFQEVNLAPLTKGQPIVLFGGLNGGGKTTLLDAIQLALYGKLARCSNRGSLAYGDYLRRCIHVGPHNVDEKASVILDFRHTIDGKEVSFRILRSWSGATKLILESVSVLRDGTFDEVLTEQWPDFVESILPSNIAHLFFFDGEKIEAFADPSRAAELLQSAIRSLLGLDLVDRLCEDLVVMERRQKLSALDSGQRVRIDEIGHEIEQLETLYKSGKQEQHILRGTLNALEHQLKEVERRFQREGGDIFEQRQRLEAEVAEGRIALEYAYQQTVQLAGQPETPLLLLPALLKRLAEQHAAERDQQHNVLLANVLETRDRWVLDRLQKLVTHETIAIMNEEMRRDRDRRSHQIPVATVAQLSENASDLLPTVLGSQIPALHDKLLKQIKKLERARIELDQRERRLAAVPELDNIQYLINKRQELQIEQARLQAQCQAKADELGERERHIARLQTEQKRLLETVAQEELKRIDAQRRLDHSRRARTTLASFRQRVLLYNIQRIEVMILKSFLALLRKDHFVQNLQIDPLTCEMTLTDTHGRTIEATRLSAGERQLLATSILWGLARASGRDLPIVIDSPLGRLDSKHRANLVERYFPRASAQVLLLSTDEEIDARYFKTLEPYIGRIYHLDYNDAEGFTQVRPGYFWPEELAS